MNEYYNLVSPFIHPHYVTFVYSDGMEKSLYSMKAMSDSLKAMSRVGFPPLCCFCFLFH